MPLPSPGQSLGLINPLSYPNQPAASEPAASPQVHHHDRQAPTSTGNSNCSPTASQTPWAILGAQNRQSLQGSALGWTQSAYN